MYFGPKEQEQRFPEYEELLKLFAAITRLFGEAEKGYGHLDPKIFERIFCRAFDADNIGNSWKSFDALKPTPGGMLGIGLKTFLGHTTGDSWSSFQKVAEFNKDAPSGGWSSQNELALDRIVSLRNARLESDFKEYGVSENRSIYHCVVRGILQGQPKFLIIEEPYHLIQTRELRPLANLKGEKSLAFTDGLNEYRFNYSKSVLLKKFVAGNINQFPMLDVSLIEDPMSELLEWYKQRGKLVTTSLERPLRERARVLPSFVEEKPKEDPKVVLPLYTPATKNNQKRVPEHAQLNQWNAGGRVRDYGSEQAEGGFGEIYIHIPAGIHRRFPGFFPPRNENFRLEIPGGGPPLTAKVCQDGGKALMSNPNTALSTWLFSILLFRPRAGQPLQYEVLRTVGKDCVIISKKGPREFSIELGPIGMFEDFIEKNSM